MQRYLRPKFWCSEWNFCVLTFCGNGNAKNKSNNKYGLSGIELNSCH